MRFWPLVVLLLGLSACSSTPERPSKDSCEFARDGECDEPDNCAVGTDSTDCRGANNNNNNNNNNCTPNCGSRVCGNDPVCGMSCGSCGMEQSCNTMGQCVSNSCMPNCQGRSCGPDPMCGMSCGSCMGNMACNSSGQCVATCEQGQTICGSDCVNTQTSNSHCGRCGNSCGPGQTCQNGQCEGGMMGQDCRQTPCTGLTYCDLNTGNCLPGCIEDRQCPMGQRCDVQSHQCVMNSFCPTFCNYFAACYPEFPTEGCEMGCEENMVPNCSAAEIAQGLQCIDNMPTQENCGTALSCLRAIPCVNFGM